jgi:hypothetical protein
VPSPIFVWCPAGLLAIALCCWIVLGNAYIKCHRSLLIYDFILLLLLKCWWTFFTGIVFDPSGTTYFFSQFDARYFR